MKKVLYFEKVDLGNVPPSYRQIFKKPSNSISQLRQDGFLKNFAKRVLEAPGIDPGTSRMLSERSTI